MAIMQPTKTLNTTYSGGTITWEDSSLGVVFMEQHFNAMVSNSTIALDTPFPAKPNAIVATPRTSSALAISVTSLDASNTASSLRLCQREVDSGAVTAALGVEIHAFWAYNGNYSSDFLDIEASGSDRVVKFKKENGDFARILQFGAQPSVGHGVTITYPFSLAGLNANPSFMANASDTVTITVGITHNPASLSSAYCEQHQRAVDVGSAFYWVCDSVIY